MAALAMKPSEGLYFFFMKSLLIAVHDPRHNKANIRQQGPDVHTVQLPKFITYACLYDKKETRKTKTIKTWPLKVKGQSWGFTSRSTARVILGQVFRIATCGTRTHRGDSL